MLHNSKRKASEQWEFTKKAKTGADEAAGVVLHSDTWIARISASLSQIDVLLLHISETSAVAEGAEIEAELAEENEAEEAERAEEREESEEACTEDPEERAECTEEPEERAECTEEPEGRAECTEEPEGRAEPEERAEDAGGWRLAVRDKGEPLGNGAFGAVFPGTAFFARREVPVAVKKFFMLENPRLYGLMNAPAVASVVQRDLLPEVNTLLSLAHRNVVRLRCVGLGRVYGAPVPAYVAMDFCSEGTLEQWIEQQRLTNVVLVAFLGDLVDAMVYVRFRGRFSGRRAFPCWFGLPMHYGAVLAATRA